MMAERQDIISVTLTKYKESCWGWLNFGQGRRCLSLGRYGLVFEVWFREWRK